MSAIDTTFHWVRNPTAINGLATTYVSKRGNDTAGDGTANNPYASIAKATSVATANTNIMLDDGEWDEARTSNNRAFKFWGNGKTSLLNFYTTNGLEFEIHNMYINKMQTTGWTATYNVFMKIYDCVVENYDGVQYSMPNYYKNCIIKNSCVYTATNTTTTIPNKDIFSLENCVVYSISNTTTTTGTNTNNAKNTIFLPTCNNLCVGKNNNYCNQQIPENAISSLNDAITGQTVADYFNKYDANDWLQCDFTAKAGSANIGAGDKGTTIGFNQGFTMYADNSADNVFKASNGATLQNIDWDSTLNGYTLVQKECVVQGATANKITLDSSASAEDDYYNNLFIGIVAGDGYGELFLISDYDGATKTATIDGTWVTIPTANNSIYTISGTILSAVKDLGKAIKVKRNWTFADNFTALQDGQWAEFMTHVETNGKQFPASCYSYEYSIDGVNFVQGQTADDLVSATNGDNKVTDAIYGDCSANYDVATAKNLIMRYIRVRVNIGFNIGQLGE